MPPRDEICGRSWMLALSALALSGIVDDSGERDEKRGNVVTYGGVSHVTRECPGSLESTVQSEGRLTGILEGL